MRKRTTITIETNSLLILQGCRATRTWCPRCAAEGETISLENLGVMSNLDHPEVEAWLNSDELHQFKTADGSSVICLNSVLAHVQNTQPTDRGIPRSRKHD